MLKKTNNKIDQLVSKELTSEIVKNRMLIKNKLHKNKNRLIEFRTINFRNY